MAEKQSGAKVKCKYCGQRLVVKCGSYSGVQRYWCKSCRRKFKGDESLFGSKVPAQYIICALIMYYNESSIDDIRYYLQDVYNYLPSKSVVFNWIRKYSDLAIQLLNKNKPNIGDIWVLDQAEINVQGSRTWILGIFDKITGYRLAFLASPVKNLAVIKQMFQQACNIARKTPKVIYTDKLLELVKAAKKNSILGENIEIKYQVLDSPIKTRKFLSVDSLNQFLRTRMIHHNYLEQFYKLDGQTAARLAGIDHTYGSWADIIRDASLKLHKTKDH